MWLHNDSVHAPGKPGLPPSKTVEVNYLAVYNTVHAALWYFKNHPGEDTSKSKLIILVASMGGYNPMASVVDYNSSKWGVRGMFWSLRNIGGILGPDKPQFRVNLIAPTWVRTRMTAGIQTRLENSESAIKVAEVSDVVDVVLRMSADENIKGK
jgi:5'-hydroxyaverantin dehydrogenase